MLEDFGSKMVFSWLSRAMFGHLGAKVGEQGPKMQQMTEKVGFLEAWRGEGVTQVLAPDLGYPPLRNSKGRGWSSHLHLEAQPGGPTWKLLELLELKMWMETSKTTASPTDRDTQHVPKGTWRITY